MQPQVLVATLEGLHRLGNGRDVLLAGHEVTALTKHGSDWWAVVDGASVWRSVDNGEWAQVASVEPLRANCLLPAVGGVFVGMSEAHLHVVRGDDIEPVSPFESVEDREGWHTPWGGPPDVRSLSADGGGSVYANVHVGGIPRSSDGGATWTPTISIDSDVHQVTCDPASGLVLAATARGLAVSADQGETWRFDTEGLHARYMRAVAVAGGTVLASASTGPYTDHAAVYRKPLSDATAFERCSNGLPDSFPSNIDTYCIDASGSDAAFGTSEGSVFISSDAGQSWTLAEEGLPQVSAVALA